MSRQRGFTLLELVTVVAIIGILAVIAVPSLVQYSRRAKSSEAIQQIGMITKGARVYYLDQQHVEGASGLIPPQFPATIGLTPIVSCCDVPAKKCSPSFAEWDAPTWAALRFSIDDPHYYRYEFISSGISADAEFTARAIGDLDCDGKQATFRCSGEVQFKGNDITLCSTIARKNELE